MLGARDKPASSADSVSVVRKAYQAYVDKDRALIESLVADDFHFTSPVDNRMGAKDFATPSY
jgi:hypothetical protein